MKNWFNRNSIHFFVAALFGIICFVYFNPAFFGKSLGQNDVSRHNLLKQK
jgi:dolichyl-phosphate-mannose--protein O-mannosyl transferase